MRTLLLCSALMLASPALAVAQDTGPATSVSDYITKAGQSDQFEIQEGQLAQQMGSSPMVKKFGSEMVAEHTKSAQMVMAATAKSGLPAPSSPPPLRADQQQMMAQLQSMSGAGFDQAYISQQMQSHQEALALQSRYAQDGDDKNLKAAARRITPVVKKHIAMLQKMQSSAGAGM